MHINCRENQMPLLDTKDTASDFQALVDRMFGEFPAFTEFPFQRLSTYTTWPAFDLYEKDGKYFMECAVPGYDPRDINVEVSGSTVTISGTYAENTEKKDAKYHRREVRRGTFSRSATLPQDIDPDKVDATVTNGLLTVTLTPLKPIEPKKILVKPKA
jgi:HSP20 family protein